MYTQMAPAGMRPAACMATRRRTVEVLVAAAPARSIVAPRTAARARFQPSLSCEIRMPDSQSAAK